jgi:peptidyl-prolyl cis-trans isomerase C
LIDQYLTQLKVAVDAKEVEDRVTQIKAEAKKDGMEFPMLLKRLLLTEEDLRRELTGALRWDKFVIQQGTDKVLKEMFDKNKNMFDGSQMRARHILIAATADNAQPAQAKVASLRKQIEDEVAVEIAKLPAGTDNLSREKERMKFLDQAFAAAAMKESTCPSKAQGGDLSWFPRAGAMVEPFARAAFALKPYQMSDAVVTEFGYHLILAVDSKPGREVTFEEVKPFVQEVYGERLREAIIVSYKPRSKIQVHAAKSEK